MKNFLLTAMFLVLTNGLFSQAIENLLERSTEIYNQALLKTENEDGEYKFCEEDYVNGNELKSHSDVSISVEGDNVHYIENLFKTEEGKTLELLIEGFSSRNLTRYLGPKGITPYDSVFVYFVNAGQKLLLLKRYNDFLENKLQVKRLYMDEGLYLNNTPNGKIVLTEASAYTYENGILSKIATSELNKDSHEFKLIELSEFKYKNNLLDENILYKYNEVDEGFTPSFMFKYSYNDSLVDTKDYLLYKGNGNYELKKRKYHEHDSTGRYIFGLYRETDDKGETWENYRRDSLIYDTPTLYLGYPNRLAAQRYYNGEWKTASSRTFKDCGSVPNSIDEVINIDFEARFADESVVFNFGDIYDKPMTIQLFDVQGNILHNRKYNAAINRIDALGLPSGLYIVKVVTRDGFGTKKLVKI